MPRSSRLAPLAALAQSFVRRPTRQVRAAIGVSLLMGSLLAPTSPALALVPSAPGAPANVHLAAGSYTSGGYPLSITWTAPASDGGSPLTGYVIKYFSRDSTAEIGHTAGPAATSDSATVTVFDQSWGAEVCASNAVGERCATAPEELFLASPYAPAQVTLTGAPGSVVAAWAAPLADVGSPITGYTVYFRQTGTSTLQAQSVAATARRVRLDDLDQGTSWVMYACALTASSTTCSGWTSPATVRAPVVPAAPTNVRATIIATQEHCVADGMAGWTPTGRVAVSWTPAWDGGSPLTGYTVTIFGPDGSKLSTQHVGPSTTSTWFDKTKPAESVSVTATNALGTSPAVRTDASC
jgi:hypothetical protein